MMERLALRHVHTLRLRPTAPFSFDATLHKPDHFPSADTAWEQKIYSVLFCGRSPEDPAPVPELLALFERRFGRYKMLAVHYVWEDLFCRRRHQPVEWLEKLIRL